MVEEHKANVARTSANEDRRDAGRRDGAPSTTASQSQHYYPPSVVLSPNTSRAAAQKAYIAKQQQQMRANQMPPASQPGGSSVASTAGNRVSWPNNFQNRPPSVRTTASGVTNHLANMANTAHPSAAGIAAATGRGSPGAPPPGSAGPSPLTRQQQRRSPSSSMAGFARAEVSLLKKIAAKSQQHPDCLGYVKSPNPSTKRSPRAPFGARV